MRIELIVFFREYGLQYIAFCLLLAAIFLAGGMHYAFEHQPRLKKRMVMFFGISLLCGSLTSVPFFL